MKKDGTGLNRNVWEGWTPQDFINRLTPELNQIMRGESWRKPFQTRDELEAYIKDAQPYYKTSIPGVNGYFAKLYALK